MFPGANAQIYRNEDGEVIGWDYPSYDEPYDWDDQFDMNYEYDAPEPEGSRECIEWGIHAKDGYGEDGFWVCDYCHEAYAEMEDDL